LQTVLKYLTKFSLSILLQCHAKECDKYCQNAPIQSDYNLFKNHYFAHYVNSSYVILPRECKNGFTLNTGILW